MELRVDGSRFSVRGVRSKVWNLEFKDQGVGFIKQGWGFRV